jgi:hypothetical protein
MMPEHEKETETKPSVKPGMGYPNDRVESSPTPIGWQGLNSENIEHVSRETKAESK